MTRQANVVLLALLFTIGSVGCARPAETGGAVVANETPDAFSMDDYRWVRRPLLVFTADATHDDYREQKRLLEAAAAGLRERDVVVVDVVASDRATADGVATPNGSAADLRRRYDVPGGGLTVLLVGKDGTEKLRSTSVVPTQQLFDLIDSMPMRRNEMRP